MEIVTGAYIYQILIGTTTELKSERDRETTKKHRITD